MEDHDPDQKRRRAINPSYPFVDQAEWQLAEFIVQRLTKTDINKFLKLDWFKTSRSRPSFKSADQLFGWIDVLPSGPQWQSTTFEFIDYTTARPMELIWRDGLEVVKDLFANPIFSNHMMYDPHLVMTGSEREYGEFFTSERAFTIQNDLPEGATIVPIILASDKTPVTRMTGGLEMHPIFLTIGNIQSEVRMKATAHAWRCIAFIPIPKFDAHADYQTLLHARLFHKCMDTIFARCKVATKIGEYMADPMGYIRHCFTPLVAYTADLPEAQLVACQHTLTLIYDLSKRIDPWSVPRFQVEAKSLMLSGVHQPFWRDWRFADPGYMLPGELLHTCHKFFGDHALKWCKEVVGEEELDARYKAHHKRVGTRHFGSGVSHISQMTCREHRDIERTMIATIAGATNATPDFVHAIRALTEFFYQAQSPVHTDSSIASMVQSLDEFHRLKQGILDAGARRGKRGTIDNFLIPKLELFHSFAGSIRALGGLIQYSADVSERLLITHCKFPFERTSRQAKSFTLQVVQILNRDETMQCFNLYTLLQTHGAPLVNAIAAEDDIVAETDPTLAWIARTLPSQQKRFHGPRPVRNHFITGLLSAEATAAFHVTVAPDRKSFTVPDLQYTYALPDFAVALTEYISKSSQGAPTTSWTCRGGSVRTWNKFRIQLLSNFQSRVVMPSQIVQSYPPSEAFPFGNCDAVLVQLTESNDVYIAQVCCVFQPTAKKGRTLPRYLEAAPLLYVQYFQIKATPADEPSVGMYRVKRIFHQDETGRIFRPGSIIPLTAVTCAVELVPVYGSKMNRTITAANSLEVCDDYYLNKFSDKEVFHTMHTDLM
ncbi:uncharacterized protein HD556DRAFT_1283310 [Suillus plorans]|uniref:DUF6830 domain-containing protein n=1 Tax=Suillus plorans TaxID=116603 RepID=A0A9P7DWK6_9AGAM|nr:uncharacterized protein HD556DRAFT_1283310 [Suillus plorans]KAG1804964.1 hypothetical protein HD556DRAFT_1283310 [Suillus plorans]